MANTITHYDGPNFDVQAHAIKLSSFEAVASEVGRNIALTKETANIIIHDVCTKLITGLQGPWPRWRASYDCQHLLSAAAPQRRCYA